jgi:anti-anti-sigma regulatory factor
MPDANNQTETKSAASAGRQPEAKAATIFAGDYLNRIAGEEIERKARKFLSEGAEEIIVDFSNTELVNSIGISILMGVIDAVRDHKADLIFRNVNEHNAELFDILGLARHVVIM